MRLIALATRTLPAVAFVSCLIVSQALAQPAGSEADATARFEAGVALITDPAGARWEEGYIQFKLAHQMLTALKSPKAWKVLGNLGISAMNIERDGEAIEAYTAYLAEGGSKLAASEKAQVERDLNTLKVGVVYVTLTSDTAGTQVTDTRQGSKGITVLTYEIGTTPTKLGVRAGNHSFVAKARSKEDRWELRLDPGQVQDHAFTFGSTPTVVPVPTTSGKPVAVPPSATAAPTAAPTAPPTDAPPASTGGTTTLRKAGYVTVGVGGALLIGGVVTGVIGKGKYNSAKDKCNPGGTICPASTQSDFDSAHSMATLTNVFLIGGAVLAAGGVTMIVLGGPKKQESSQVTQPGMAIAPVAMPGGGGLFAQGRF